MNINSNLINIRKKLGLTQTVFAEKLETSQNLISKYEKGTVELPYKIINNLNKVFNININWLLTNSGEMFNTNDKETTLLVNTVNESRAEYNSIENTLIDDIKKLSQKRQEYYYHRVKADLLDDEI